MMRKAVTGKGNALRGIDELSDGYDQPAAERQWKGEAKSAGNGNETTNTTTTTKEEEHR